MSEQNKEPCAGCNCNCAGAPIGQEELQKIAGVLAAGPGQDEGEEELEAA